MVAIGVDFTACTMLPVTADNTPLCLLPEWKERPHAWPKLWKHHGAAQQALALTAEAKARQEPWLARYGGHVGVEWLFPKMLQTYQEDQAVAEAAAGWVEAGDWLVAQLCSASAASTARSTCQAGYKALWSREDGLPSQDFLDAVAPGFGSYAADRLRCAEFVAPGQAAGHFASRQALLDLENGGFGAVSDGVAVSAVAIDAHAGVPGVGAYGAGQMVLVMGTSNCYMLNAEAEATHI